MNDKLDMYNRVERNDLQARNKPNLLGVTAMVNPIFWGFSHI